MLGPPQDLFGSPMEKNPGTYWDSGVVTPGVPAVSCKIYKAPYIKGGDILLVWAPLLGSGNPSDEIRIQKLTFGEINAHDYALIGNQTKDFEVTFHKKHFSWINKF